MRRLIPGLIVSLAFCAFADLTLTQIQTTQSIKNGQPEKDEKVQTSTLWISANTLRMDTENESVLLLAQKDSVYLIDNKKKTYNGISLIALGTSAAQASDMPPEMQAMMANMMKMEVSITATGETKKINNWNCTKYLQTLTMMGVTTTSELWATTDVKINSSIMQKFTASMFLKSQSTKDLAAKLLKEAEKINGYVVYSVSNTKAMGKETKSISEIREIKESPAPAGIYQIPAKYKLKDWE